MPTPRFMPVHGGYKTLKSFQGAEISYDFTVAFCTTHVDQLGRTPESYRRFSRQSDQMIQAARSGVQNIVEGSQAAAQSLLTEYRLVGVARASLEELLRDYKDFLRQRGLREWGKDDSRAREVRALAYASHRSYKTYETYLEDPERAANAALCLISQTTYLLDRQLEKLERGLVLQGDVKERAKVARDEEMKRRIVYGDGPPMDEFLKGLGFVTLPDGRVTKLDKKE